MFLGSTVTFKPSTCFTDETPFLFTCHALDPANIIFYNLYYRFEETGSEFLPVRHKMKDKSSSKEVVHTFKIPGTTKEFVLNIYCDMIDRKGKTHSSFTKLTVLNVSFKTSSTLSYTKILKDVTTSSTMSDSSKEKVAEVLNGMSSDVKNAVTKITFISTRIGKDK